MNTNRKQKIIVIVGATASGKTALAIQVAKKIGGEIISADSRQVYRGLNIGTEKVSREEMDGIPHHLIDIAEVGAVYTAAGFKDDAEHAIEDITARGKVPIIAGGTFFYVAALLCTVSIPQVPPDETLRRELEIKDADTLYAALKRLDPNRAKAIDPNNKRRLIRALEIIQALGSVPAPLSPETPYDALIVGIHIDRAALRARIRNRAKRAVARGLVEETKQLLARGVARERLAAIGLEYPLAMAYLDGDLTDAALIEKLEEKNWQYAKRQLAWLARMDDIRWFRSDDPKIQTAIAQFLHS